MKKKSNTKAAKTAKPKVEDVELPLAEAPKWDYEAGDYRLARRNHPGTNILKSASLYSRGRWLKELEKMEWSSCCELADFLYRRFPAAPPPMKPSSAEIEMMKSPAERMQKHYTSTDPAVARIAVAAASGSLFTSGKGGAK